MLIWLLSKPPTWQLNTKSLSKIHKVGVNKITEISKTLQKYNHLKIQKLSTGDTVWHVFDMPEVPQNTAGTPIVPPYIENQYEAKKPDIEKPYMAQPDMENQYALVSTDLLVKTDCLPTAEKQDYLKQSPTTRKRHTLMDEHWQPDKRIVEIIQARNIPKDFAIQELASFTSLHLDQPLLNADNKFLKFLQDDWNTPWKRDRFLNGVQPSGQTAKQEKRSRLTESLMDIGNTDW